MAAATASTARGSATISTLPRATDRTDSWGRTACLAIIPKSVGSVFKRNSTTRRMNSWLSVMACTWESVSRVEQPATKAREM